MFVSPSVRRQQLLDEIAGHKRAIRQHREKMQQAMSLLQRLNQQSSSSPSGEEGEGVLHGPR